MKTKCNNTHYKVGHSNQSEKSTQYDDAAPSFFSAKMQSVETALPYRISVLCYLFDRDGRTLLIHRRKEPNCDLYSPIGGKLEMTIGESPTTCAVREIAEEAGLTVRIQNLHLTGIISEAGYENTGHWLMFLYELTHPVELPPMTIREGRLEWHDPQHIMQLPIPQTDREIIWPMFWLYRGRFFMGHINCHNGRLEWSLEQPGHEIRH